MSRINEIDIFLKKVSNLAESNVYITPDLIYSLLMKYDFNAEEYKNGNISQYFGYWSEFFKDKKDIKVFNHPMQKNFLQFWNGRENSSEYIKLYVSVNKNSMLKVVNEIFTHLENRKVLQCSKVSNKVRSDSIVLRIKNEKDAREIIDFINNNKYIKDNARKTNPFLLRDGVVGLAYDDNLSYNTAVSFLVSEYINSKKEKSDFINTNCIDFLNYVSNYSRNLITNKDFLKKFEETDYFKENRNILEHLYKYEVLTNIKRVFDLVVFNLNENHTYEDFINMYTSSINNKDEMINDFKKLTIENKKIDPSILLNNYLSVAFSKYHTKENVLAYLNSYMNGNINAITREGNFRSEFSKNMSPEIVQELTKGNIEKYIGNYIEFQDKYSLFVNSCIATYNKYGILQLEYAIDKAVKGDYSSFTRDNGLRSMMKERLDKDEIQKCISKITQLPENVLNENSGFHCARAIEEIYIQEKNNKSK